jgi:hypothetical protein
VAQPKCRHASERGQVQQSFHQNLGGRNLRVNDLRNTIIAEDRRSIGEKFDFIAAIGSNRIAAIRPRPDQA